MLTEIIKSQETFIMGPIDTMFATSPRVSYIGFDLHTNVKCEIEVFQCNASKVTDGFPIEKLQDFVATPELMFTSGDIRVTSRYCFIHIKNVSNEEGKITISSRFFGNRETAQTPSLEKPILSSYKKIDINAKSTSPLDFVLRNLPSEVRFNISDTKFVILPVTWDVSELVEPLVSTAIRGTINTNLYDVSKVPLKADLIIS